MKGTLFQNRLNLACIQGVIINSLISRYKELDQTITETGFVQIGIFILQLVSSEITPDE